MVEGKFVLLLVITASFVITPTTQLDSKQHFKAELFHNSHPNLTKNSTAYFEVLMDKGFMRMTPPNFGTAVEYGNFAGTPQYLVKVGIGTPPQYQYLAIDTGSDVTWVQCQPCDHCYSQKTPMFDALASSTARPVPCKSVACKMLGKQGHCIRGQCQYKTKYMDKSYSQGQYAFETFRFGETSIPNIAVGFGHKNKGTFVGFAGLLGLGGGYSFRKQLGDALPMSFCLPVPHTASVGWLEIGDLPGAIQWISMHHHPKFPDRNYVELLGLAVNGKKVLIPQNVFQLTEEGEGGVVVDTGTVITRFPTIAYEALQAAFVEETESYMTRAPPMEGFDTCYLVPPLEGRDSPSVSFYFSGGSVLTIRSGSLLIRMDGLGTTYCLSFVPSSSQLSIIGNLHLAGIQITMDGLNQLMGFGPKIC